MKFSGYHFYKNANEQGDFQICINVPLSTCSFQKKQKQPPEVFYKKGVHKNFANFTGNICVGVSFS